MKKENNFKSSKITHKTRRQMRAERRLDEPLPTGNHGLKELLKRGEITVKTAIEKLVDKGGELVEHSATFKWLGRKAQKI